MNRLVYVAIIVFGLSAFSAPSASAITLEVSPSSTTVLLGTSVGVEVVISGLGDLASPSLGTFDIDVSFIPTILSFSSVTFGSFLGDPSVEATASGSILSPGILDVFEVSLLLPADLIALQPSSFSLGTLTFTTLSTGTSGLDVSIQALGDETGDPLTATPHNGLVTVTPESVVTEPATLLLLATGLAHLGAVAWRHRRHVT